MRCGREEMTLDEVAGAIKRNRADGNDALTMMRMANEIASLKRKQDQKESCEKQLKSRLANGTGLCGRNGAPRRPTRSRPARRRR